MRQHRPKAEGNSVARPEGTEGGIEDRGRSLLVGWAKEGRAEVNKWNSKSKTRGGRSLLKGVSRKAWIL